MYGVFCGAKRASEARGEAGVGGIIARGHYHPAGDPVMAYPFVSTKQEFLELEAYEVHHWPIVRAYAERLGVGGVNQPAGAERDGDRSRHDRVRPDSS